MNSQQLATAITAISGQIQVDTSEEKKQLNILHEQLAEWLVSANAAEIQSQPFSFQTASRFSSVELSTQPEEKLKTISETALAFKPKQNYRMFIRDTPVRSSGIKSSVPDWAAGATAAKILGPFKNLDGRRLWYDFYPVEELIGLYVQGSTQPVLLFHTTVLRRILGSISPGASLTESYNLSGTTIWIYSPVLASDAPPGTYTGLLIKSGEISLSDKPQLISNQVTIQPTTTVKVTLSLGQASGPAADPSSDYGKDARAATLSLPGEFHFHFTGNAMSFVDIAAEAVWELYGQKASFTWNNKQTASYNQDLKEILIPYTCSENQFTINSNLSAWNALAATAPVNLSAWALPVATIDTGNPTAAEGTGAMTIRCNAGLTTTWAGLKNALVNLNSPYLQLSPGKISILDTTASSLGASQDYLLWQDSANPHRSSVHLTFNKFPFLFVSAAEGAETIVAVTIASPNIDRPVTVSGSPPVILAKNALMIISATKDLRLLYVYDDNILAESATPYSYALTYRPKAISFALSNALFKTTNANGFLLFASLAADFILVDQGVMFLTFGLFAYLPTLPDPYAANLGLLQEQFGNAQLPGDVYRNPSQKVWIWLVCEVNWKEIVQDGDSVDVSFYFAPLQLSNLNVSLSPFIYAAQTDLAGRNANFQADSPGDVHPNPQQSWDNRNGIFEKEVFALLDVSSNANQMGVSFGEAGIRLRILEDKALLGNAGAAPDAASAQNDFPIQIAGMNVVAKSLNVRAFTVPQISWEPVINLTKVDPGDPPLLFNYYPDDGGATRITNNSVALVPLAPIPVSAALIENYDIEKNNVTAAYFTLPFGMRSLALLHKSSSPWAKNPGIAENNPSFANQISGGIQLRLTGAPGGKDKSNQFQGVTIQTNNVLSITGNPTGTSTLGSEVTTIFNNNFFYNSQSVPVTRIDLSGYGANLFSNWLNAKAEFADTSQVEFEVFNGRTAHEVVQVKSVLYPWGIHVVRTVTLFRTASGYEYRYDSGWKADSEGRFDFTYTSGGATVLPFEIHPGIITVLSNVQNIVSAAADVASFTVTADNVQLDAVYFDADIQIENVVQGQINGRVTSKKMLGFVQISPSGVPISPVNFQKLLNYQNGSIGGSVDCIVDIGNNGQQIRVNRVDVNAANNATGSQPVFVAAARGNVILPREGSWTMVTHLAKTGEVIALAEGITVPVIRIGTVKTDLSFPKDGLWRIANPTELLRNPGADTINFGYLQSTGTQKALFLTPAYQLINKKDPGKLLSKTPPLFADAYRIMNSTGIFPNVGDALTGFGDAIALSGNFLTTAINDGAAAVSELMQINQKDALGNLLQEGFQLLKQKTTFSPGLTDWDIIKTDALRVYVHYNTPVTNPDPSPPGPLNFDINSFAAGVADKWRSNFSNLSMIVDLGSLKGLLTIVGCFNSQNGNDPNYAGDATNPSLPTPQLILSDDLEKAKDILQILADLQTGDYADALKKGLQIAMSNDADSWEYKFNASQEIPVLKFPTPDFVYDDPNTPLKLQASLKFGLYFNAALKVTTDPKQLLPTAGAYLNFMGNMSVMCVSLSIATVYAVGTVDLTIGADTANGPSLDMKFGFGAQIVIGLPIVGNVSVLYMIGVEIFLNASTLTITASLLYQGHADLLAGMVNITITIEAQGAVSRTGGTGTILTAEVTFAIDISLFLVIDIDFSKTWSESRQIA